ncbi:hypothetical protein [Novosphingobium sp. AP12]|uniref:hypothetical protein n=1 Tax=Novosphingobium sp. AP12 TaxID=1144305 RepID=UPI000271F1B5|nr:hypothetical protein [Novosphingobium sp. AP12]EJL24228.1 hypothetical protein PMI02_03730 [Novosphingobium sp. AP12]
MTELDELLGKVRAMPVDPRLAGMESAVFAGVASRRARASSRGRLALAGVVAISVGVFGGVLADTGPGHDVRPAMVGMSDYAPSRLLG